jgi:hypothetical protein
MSWRTLLVELFDEDMREHWGWRAPRSIDGLVERPVRPDACIELDVGGLPIPYFCGWVKIDFAARKVTCDAIDQKTPADMRWELEPEEQWWTRALACNWPQRG